MKTDEKDIKEIGFRKFRLWTLTFHVFGFATEGRTSVKDKTKIFVQEIPKPGTNKKPDPYRMRFPLRVFYSEENFEALEDAGGLPVSEEQNKEYQKRFKW